jgi:hypothetical protein
MWLLIIVADCIPFFGSHIISVPRLRPFLSAFVAKLGIGFSRYRILADRVFTESVKRVPPPPRIIFSGEAFVIIVAVFINPSWEIPVFIPLPRGPDPRSNAHPPGRFPLHLTGHSHPAPALRVCTSLVSDAGFRFPPSCSSPPLLPSASTLSVLPSISPLLRWMPLRQLVLVVADIPRRSVCSALAALPFCSVPSLILHPSPPLPSP